MKEEVKELQLIEPTDLDKPQKDTDFAKAAATLLVDIIKQNNWSKKLGGQSEHIQYEGWQTVGKYYGYLVKTFDSEYVEYGGVWGFKAKATVVNEHTGIEVGGAEAYCMSDEYNWKNKPKFQLASMAQTRAGSKALRQILGFVVALAGYNPTPLEEMEKTGLDKTVEAPKVSEEPKEKKIVSRPITMSQKTQLLTTLGKKGKNVIDLTKFIEKKFHKSSYKELTDVEAEFVIKKLDSLQSTTQLTEPI